MTAILQQIFENSLRSLGGGGRMIDRGKRNLLGVAISAVDYEYAVAKIIGARTGAAVAVRPLRWRYTA